MHRLKAFSHSRPTGRFFSSIWFALQTKSIYICSFILLCDSTPGFCQRIISGRITDESRKPIAYATILIAKSSDGTISDSSGHFRVRTGIAGDITLLVSAMGYQAVQFALAAAADTVDRVFILKPEPRPLQPIVVTAGTIEATDDRVLTVVKPVDILSNASSRGDLVGAFENMPGVQRNGGDQTGLVVRGGDAAETGILLDGTAVQDPFFSNVPGVGQQSRFNPFQVKGMAFSTGGYSARFGQALSSILDLQTSDIPDKTSIAMGVNLAGGMVSGAARTSSESLEYGGNYTNFGPYFSLAKTNLSFFKKPENAGGSLKWTSQLRDKGLFKVAAAYNASQTGVYVNDPNDLLQLIPFSLRNQYLTIHSSIRYRFSEHWKLFAAAAYSHNTDRILWSDTTFHREDHRVQGRAELTYNAGRAFKLTVGGELQHYQYSLLFDTVSGAFIETLTAAFAEAEIQPTNWIALKPGIRIEHSGLLRETATSPRLALALKPGGPGQFGFATGVFYQDGPTNYLLFGYRPRFQQAVHYLLNYEWISNNRTFRIETYYKDYAQLVRDHEATFDPNQLYRFRFGPIDNSGHGYAKGFDVFFRDKATFKNFDYWITYSFIDTKRLYENYPVAATPDFISTNNLNVIVKYFSEALHTAVSAAYNYASGRPYYNPLNPVFLGDRSPAWQNVSFKASYLANLGSVFSAWYVNFDNLANHHNILGYRYSDNGAQRSAILPPQYFAVFFGVYLSFSEFKKEDL